MMKKNVLRLLALLLALLLLAGCGGKKAEPAATAAPKTTTQPTAKPTPVPAPTPTPKPLIDDTLGPDEAFEAGNRCYKEEAYLEAEAYYELAIGQLPAKENKYCYHEVANNLVLAKLQLEKNEEAYMLCLHLLDSNVAPSVPDLYGAVLNLLVCGHALGKRSAEVMDDAMHTEGTQFVNLAFLNEMAAGEPGKFGALVTALVYNMVYMDMEGSLSDAEKSFDFYPLLDLPDAGLENTRAKLSEYMSALDANDREEYLQFMVRILKTAQERNKAIYDEEDPDIEKLISYIYELESVEAKKTN